jgi:alcohol dehydrogenase class IV
MDIYTKTISEGTVPPRTEGAYRMPTESHFGRGAISKLPGIFKQSKRVLAVAAEHVKQKPEFIGAIAALSAEAEVIVYEPPIKASDFETINALIDFARAREVDAVLAVGGGAVLDTAKCAAALARAEGTIEDYVRSKGRELRAHGLFFVAVPTTAGTGSEVTPWATVWGSDLKKYSLASPEYLFPDAAVVDPSLTDSLPSYETAVTGMDALTQAMEAYWNVNHNPISDEYALEAIRLVLGHLERAATAPIPDARDHMMAASFFAGLAFSNTQTTLCHAVSYPMTTHWGVAHGQAVSITLPAFIEYIIPALPEERQKAFLAACTADSVSDAARKVRELMRRIGLKTRLSELSIPPEGIDVIVAEGFHPDRAKNSPKIPTPEELKRLLESSY